MPTDDAPTRQIEPEFFEKLGRLITHWALLEATLVDLLAACLHADPGMTVLLAQTVSGATITDWVRKRSWLQDNPAESLEELDRILKEMDELRSERNTLVHGLWTTDASYAGTVLVQNLRLHSTHPARQQLITLDDLDSLIHETLEVYRSLRAFLIAHGIGRF